MKFFIFPGTVSFTALFLIDALATQTKLFMQVWKRLSLRKLQLNSVLCVTTSASFYLEHIPARNLGIHLFTYSFSNLESSLLIFVKLGYFHLQFSWNQSWVLRGTLDFNELEYMKFLPKLKEEKYFWNSLEGKTVPSAPCFQTLQFLHNQGKKITHCSNIAIYLRCPKLEHWFSVIFLLQLEFLALH